MTFSPQLNGVSIATNKPDFKSYIDKNKDNKVTDEEIFNYHNKDRSSELDANGDGIITDDEIANYTNSISNDGSQTNPPAQNPPVQNSPNEPFTLNDLINETLLSNGAAVLFDKDGDNNISADEYYANGSFTCVMKDVPQELRDAYFQDTGKVLPNQITSEGLLKLEYEYTDISQDCDTNGDGTVSAEEKAVYFQNNCLKHFIP